MDSILTGEPFVDGLGLEPPRDEEGDGSASREGDHTGILLQAKLSRVSFDKGLVRLGVGVEFWLRPDVCGAFRVLPSIGGERYKKAPNEHHVCK
jgi:hypothetical protein